MTEPMDPTDRPRQYFPDTDPNLPTIDPTHPDPDTVHLSDAQPKRRTWPWILLILALIAALGAGGAWWYSERANQQPWQGKDADIARAFPGLVSLNDGGKAPTGMRCHSATPEGDELAKIRCASPDAGINIYAFESPEQRDAALPAEQEHFANDVCTLASAELPDQALPAYFLAPSPIPGSPAPSNLDRFLLIVNGADAENFRLQLPIC